MVTLFAGGWGQGMGAVAGSGVTGQKFILPSPLPIHRHSNIPYGDPFGMGIGIRRWRLRQGIGQSI